MVCDCSASYGESGRLDKQEEKRKADFKVSKEGVMLIRNIVEIALIIVLVIVGIIVYFYLKRRIDDASSELKIRKKKEIKEKIEELSRNG